jgi:hypothetical protein
MINDADENLFTIATPVDFNRGPGWSVADSILNEERAAASPYLSSRGKAARHGTS